eukprot:TRINITY_DN33224_c0_g2_i1.p1 TRINITY_DN33224_c0_g2~~TRINITY_DN33224_c0_g2_i1.p1  ORF type:complete len:103 (+),score=6.52 TRINITY_DN33224_c0_g2_i1:308-616(+)
MLKWDTDPSSAYGPSSGPPGLVRLSTFVPRQPGLERAHSSQTLIQPSQTRHIQGQASTERDPLIFLSFFSLIKTETEHNFMNKKIKKRKKKSDSILIAGFNP